MILGPWYVLGVPRPPKTPLLNTITDGTLSGKDLFSTAMQDFPLLRDTPLESPDPNKSLRQVVIDMVYDHYAYHHIFTSDQTIFLDRTRVMAYEVMVQLQYVLGQWAALLDDDQFFYNTEDETINTNRQGTGNATDSNTQKNSNTPQNSIVDIDQYMSSASKNDGTTNTTNQEAGDSERHLRKSMLGDIAYRFKEFIEMPDIYQIIIRGFRPLFKADFTDDEVYPD